MPTDIKAIESDNFYDIEIADGDFIADESTYQHQGLLFMSYKGDFKENPARCVGTIRYIETGDTQGLAREIGTEYSMDGMAVNEIKINFPEVKIEANYIEL